MKSIKIANSFVVVVLFIILTTLIAMGISIELGAGSPKSELERGLETSVSDSSRMGVSNDGEKPCADKQEEFDSK